MESDFQVIVEGLPRDISRAVNLAVLKVVDFIEKQHGELDLRRMHRIIVAEDFAHALASLSAASESNQPISHTDEEYAVAIAKVVSLPYGEDYEIVPVIRANYALALLESEDDERNDEVSISTDISSSEAFHMVVHGLHHELCHVHENNQLIDRLGIPTIKHVHLGKEAYTYSLAYACWSEYVANFLSTSTMNQIWLELMVNNFDNAVGRTKMKFDHEILDYRVQKISLSQLLNSFDRHGIFLVKSASYLLGYLDGLNVTLSDLSSAVSVRLAGSYFEPTWIAMHEAFKNMRHQYETEWSETTLYDTLAQVMESYYAQMGLVLETTRSGQVYVDVPLRPETTPDPEQS